MNNIERAIEQLKDDIDTAKCVYKDTMLGKSKEHFIKCYSTAISALEKQLNGGWIPVSERLPKSQPSYVRGRSYIITEKQYGYNKVVRFARYKESKWIGDFGRIISDENVVAWMPLPEPWKEVNNE